jgi:citrate synthase
MEVPKGLEGVEVDVTKISLVDGERGRLSYRGRDVTQLVDWPFSRVVLLVLTGEEPTAAECRAFETALLRASRLSEDDAALLTLAAKTKVHPMAALQGLVPLRRGPPNSRATAMRRTDTVA